MGTTLSRCKCQKHLRSTLQSCGGCSGAVTKALKRVEGVEDVVIDMVGQKVTVTGVVPKETMFSAIEETGKAVSYTDESHCVE